MKNGQKIIDEEEIKDKKIRQTIRITFGHLARITRLVSPLSHNEMQTLSSINSSTMRRLEIETNFSIHSYAEAIYYHFESVKCKFNIYHLCKQITHALFNGKCLVIRAVDSNELEHYDPRTIILWQQSDDTEELARRKKCEHEALHIAQKLNGSRYHKAVTNCAYKRKKKKKK